MHKHGRKAVLRLWLLLPGELDRNGGNRLQRFAGGARLDFARPVLSGSCFKLDETGLLTGTRGIDNWNPTFKCIEESNI